MGANDAPIRKNTDPCVRGNRAQAGFLTLIAIYLSGVSVADHNAKQLVAAGIATSAAGFHFSTGWWDGTLHINAQLHNVLVRFRCRYVSYGMICSDMIT